MCEVVLVACGSFNPPTLAHLRMMEMAKEHIELMGFKVTHGYYSPVNDAYTKPGLLPAQHRLEMLRLAVQESDWLGLDDWEANLSTWTPTSKVLSQKKHLHLNARIMLVAGSDICKSFNVPGLWPDEQLLSICSPEHGLILIERNTRDEWYEEILKNKVLYANQMNIFFVHQPIKSELSSTKVRMLCKIGSSVKYLVPNKVEEYIEKHSLYK